MQWIAKSRSVVAAAAAALFVACRLVPALAPPVHGIAPEIVAEGIIGAVDSAAAKPTYIDSTFVIATEIHGRRILLEADYGSDGTVVTETTIALVGMPHRFAGAERADTLVRRNGVLPPKDSMATIIVTRGDSVFQYFGEIPDFILDSLRVGRSLQDKVALANEAPAEAFGQLGGLLGRDILSQFDLEFNFVDRALRLYRRTEPVATSRRPAWLPRGIAAEDCAPAVSHRLAGLDTATLDASDSAEVRTNPGKRVWETTQLLVPATMNGRRIDAHFDSGSPVTLMNWAAARMLGFDEHSPNVVVDTSGLTRPVIMNPISAYENAPVYRASGITLRVGRWDLPADSVYVSDGLLADLPSVATEPTILIGRHMLRDFVLYLSHSTNHVCLTRGASATRAP